MEYTKLPGIVNDRFFALAASNSKIGIVTKESFVKLMLTVFSNKIKQKMQLVF